MTGAADSSIPLGGNGAEGALRVRTWSEAEFASSKYAWDRLLASADADPLFMSWDWQWRWWSHHAKVLDASLRLVAFYAGEALVGLAPFYSRTVIVRRFFTSRRMEILGIAWRDPRAVFSDYLDLIAARGHERAVLEALADWLAAETDWQELVLCCTKRDGLACRLASLHLSRLAYVREVDPLTAWRARLPAHFDDYLERLDAKIRRKLFHQRRKLARPQIQYATAADIPEFLGLLGKYSAARWGGAAPRGDLHGAFHLDIAQVLERSGELRLSRLVTEEGARSVMYNVRKQDTVYYIQSAFDPEGSRGLSLGTLHFGYAIEAACREGAVQFDFLAGPGKHRDYKQDFLTDCVPVVSYHAVRGGLARAAYAAYERFKGIWGVWRVCGVRPRWTYSRHGSRPRPPPMGENLPEPESTEPCVKQRQ